jgi:hypothetical protein
MAVKDKTTLEADIDALFVVNSSGTIEADDVNTLMDDIVDSYQDVIVSYTTAQRDLLSATEKMLIYNTDNDRFEFYDGTSWKGVTPVKTFLLDCSANPNYPAAQKGDRWLVSVAGKVGGGSGESVNVGDWITCKTTNAGGTSVSVGADFVISYTASAYGQNIGVKTIPQTSVDGDVDPINSYSTSPTVFATEEIDLTQVATYNYNFETGTKFIVDRIRVIVTEITYSSTDTDAVIDFGESGDANLFTTYSSSVGTADGETAFIFNGTDEKAITDFQIDVTTGSTQSVLKVRFIITGVSIQDEGLA